MNQVCAGAGAVIENTSVQRRWISAIRLVTALVVMSVTRSGHAATYCVGTVQELNDALAKSVNFAGPDEIRIKSGVLVPPATTVVAFDNNIITDGDLTLSGGWDDGAGGPGSCSDQYDDASLTVIDGELQVGLLRIAALASIVADVRISNLTLKNGFVPNTAGNTSSCLSIRGSQTSGLRVWIERVAFVGCTSDQIDEGSAVRIDMGSTGSSAVVANNLFEGAVTAGKPFSFNALSGGQVFLNQNSFLRNQISGTPEGFFDSSIVIIFSVSGAQLDNNLFGYSETTEGSPLADIEIGGITPVALHNNRYAQLIGNPSSSSGNLVGPPGVVSSLDPHLRRNALEIDAGLPMPAGGIGSVDLDGRPRINGAAPDIGAFEYPRLFFDGFE